MSRGVNKVILIGRLGADPEVRYTNDGKPFTTFRMVTGEDPYTEWHSIIAGGRTGELCGEYLYKGSEVYVEGSISYKQYETTNGDKAWSTSVRIFIVQFLGGKNDQSSSSSDSPSGSDDDDLDFDFE